MAIDNEMPPTTRRWLAAYLGIGSATTGLFLVCLFPSALSDVVDKAFENWLRCPCLCLTGEKRMLVLALASGAMGGFLHAAMSVVQYRAVRR